MNEHLCRDKRETLHFGVLFPLASAAHSTSDLRAHTVVVLIRQSAFSVRTPFEQTARSTIFNRLNHMWKMCLLAVCCVRCAVCFIAFARRRCPAWPPRAAYTATCGCERVHVRTNKQKTFFCPRARK